MDTVPLHTNYCACTTHTHTHTHTLEKNSNFLVPWEFAAKVLERLCLGSYIPHPALFHAFFPLYIVFRHEMEATTCYGHGRELDYPGGQTFEKLLATQ